MNARRPPFPQKQFDQTADHNDGYRQYGGAQHELETTADFERPDRVADRDIDDRQNMPDIGEASAHHRQEAVAITADPNRHRRPVLQYQHDQQQRDGEAEHLEQRIVRRRVQPQQMRGVQDQESVNRQIGEPFDPDEKVVCRLVAQREQLQLSHFQRQQHTRHRDHTARQHAGVDQRNCSEPFARLFRSEQGQSALGCSSKYSDWRQIEYPTGQQQNRGEGEIIVSPGFDGAARPAQRHAR